MIRRMTGPNAISAGALSLEVGVPQPTLSAWLRLASRLPGMGKDPTDDPASAEPRGPKNWTVEEKLRVVLEAASIPEDGLGAFLRRNGIHSPQLEEWRKLVIDAAKEALAKGRKAAKGRSSVKDEKRLRDLERELRRKDSALAEVTALLALKKKLEMLWEDGEDDTRTRSGT
jgi:transposase-like protein